MRSQTQIEYLIMVGIGVLLALVATAGVLFVFNTMAHEIEKAYQLKDAIVGGLK